MKSLQHVVSKEKASENTENIRCLKSYIYYIHGICIHSQLLYLSVWFLGQDVERPFHLWMSALLGDPTLLSPAWQIHPGKLAAERRRKWGDARKSLKFDQSISTVDIDLIYFI